MSVTVRLPPVLRADVGGARTVELDAPGDLRGALDDARRTSTRGCARSCSTAAATSTGFVNVYVDQEDVRLGEGLDTSLRDGATVIVLPAMAGGDR